MKSPSEQTCTNCRFWSQMCAMVEGGVLKALCLSSDGPKASRFTVEGYWCGKWKENTIGSVDEPPNYGALVRPIYDREER